MTDLEAVRRWLAEKVSSRRLLHSEGVLAAATDLADSHGVEAAPLQLAAMVHDCARELAGDELLRRAGEWELPLRQVDRISPVLLHGRVGMEMARRELGIDDPRVVSAVYYHTAGHPDMDIADKLFFLADHIEPGRGYERVDELRRLAAADVDAALLLAIDINLDYLSASGKTVDPDTLALRARLSGRNHSP